MPFPFAAMICGLLLAGMPCIATTAAEPTVPARTAGSAATLLKQPWGSFFWCARTAGVLHLGDAQSHFNAAADPDKLTYDISNNAMLAIHGFNGELKALTCYRDTYITLTTSWPGVWTAKDNSTYGPYSFSVELDGTTYDLAKVDWDLRTGLLDNTIPVTELTAPGKRFIARIVTFAPISADGSQRLRGVVYGLQLENTSTAPLKATVLLPKLPCGSKPYDRWAQSDAFGSFDISLGDAPSFAPRIIVDLAPGARAWVPVILAAPGEGVAEAINTRGTMAWLADTQTYYRHILGRLVTPGQPFVGEFYERMLMQALQSIGQSGSGRISGSNWGSVPATRMIWSKDFYYSSLPLMTADPAFAQKLIAWFTTYGVRPKGTLVRAEETGQPGATAGGVNHSISLSVAAPLLAGILYDSTGDRALFLAHPEWKAAWGKVLDEILDSRIDRAVWLFPTNFISDGPVRGDYHTGSNVCVWAAVTAYSRLLGEVWKDQAGARTYAAAAARIKAALMTKTVIAGPSGLQFIDAVTRTGGVPRMESDGEESDTTLMPFYGLIGYDDPIYTAYMRFSVSPANAAYRPALHAISWEGSVPSTAPGYNKGLCAYSDATGLFAADGTFTQMRRLADGDGSLWWWSYGQEKDPRYGSPTRGYMDIGKSGWAAGVFSCLVPSRFIGVTYDAPTTTLDLSPLPALGDFSWTDLPMGNDRFTVACSYVPGRDPGTTTVTLLVVNSTPHATHLVARIAVGAGQGLSSVSANGVVQKTPSVTTQGGRRDATVSVLLAPMARMQIIAVLHSSGSP